MNTVPSSSQSSSPAARDSLPNHESEVIKGISVVMVGMMGAGKTSVGKRLAQRLQRPFVDSDARIEAAAGCSVAEFFTRYGEPAFRDQERKTVVQILSESPAVISLGGGAFIDAESRALIHTSAISVWLKADIDILLERALRHGTRPLLETAHPRERMKEILKVREAIYAEADIIVESDNRPVDITASRVQKAILDYLKNQRPQKDM